MGEEQSDNDGIDDGDSSEEMDSSGSDEGFKDDDFEYDLGLYSDDNEENGVDDGSSSSSSDSDSDDLIVPPKVMSNTNELNANELNVSHVSKDDVSLAGEVVGNIILMQCLAKKGKSQRANTICGKWRKVEEGRFMYATFTCGQVRKACISKCDDCNGVTVCTCEKKCGMCKAVWRKCVCPPAPS